MNIRGQSIIEYTIVVGIITVALYYMGTGLKRGVQSLVKITADQVGNQQNSDQDFNDIQSGYMQGSNETDQDSKNRQITEVGYIPVTGPPSYVSSISENEETSSMTNTLTNGGFTPNGPI